MSAPVIDFNVGHCKYPAQTVMSERGSLVAFICRRCLVVLCRDCKGRVFEADSAREARMYRCRSATPGKR